jgi:hypothetical protein
LPAELTFDSRGGMKAMAAKKAAPKKAKKTKKK